MYNLNNDRLTVGFLSRKCGSYFNESQVDGICKAVVSLLGKLFFIDVNLEMMQCRDWKLKQFVFYFDWLNTTFLHFLKKV